MILIVDDNQENIFSLKALLTLHNFEVDTASSGEEALRKILLHSYALVILDVQMPEMDGFEVAEAVSGYSRSKDIPIIFLSAINTHKKFVARGYTTGGIDYVTKPVDPDILLLKIKTFYRLSGADAPAHGHGKVLREEIELRKKAERAFWRRRFGSVPKSSSNRTSASKRVTTSSSSLPLSHRTTCRNRSERSRRSADLPSTSSMGPKKR